MVVKALAVEVIADRTAIARRRDDRPLGRHAERRQPRRESRRLRQLSHAAGILGLLTRPRAWRYRVRPAAE
jgi:hypothetical protein